MNRRFFLVFLASIVLSLEAFALPPDQEFFVENTLSTLFLDKYSCLSPQERVWLNERAITYKKLAAKSLSSSKIEDEFKTLAQLEKKQSASNKRLSPSLLSNDVATCSQRYLLTEAPRTETLGTFWKTILDNDVRLIITLVSPVEERKKHLSLFWDTAQLPYHIENWMITLTSEGLIEKDSKKEKRQLYSRLFLAQNTVTGQSRSIQQLHYLNWPDCGRPEISLLEQLVTLTIQLHPERERPILVHCAAGIGRTGTFVTTHSLCKEIWDARNRFFLKTTPINVAERLLLLRWQRPHLVSSTGQYLSIYETMTAFIGRLKKEDLLQKNKKTS